MCLCNIYPRHYSRVLIVSLRPLTLTDLCLEFSAALRSRLVLSFLIWPKSPLTQAYTALVTASVSKKIPYRRMTEKND